MVLAEHYTLSNGIEIPKLGLGTWMIADDKAADAVRAAVAIGYRHIDTAQGYDNERGVGDGVRTSGVPREELFVTTKLEADFKTYDEAKTAIEGSLAALDIGYIDLMIIHSPWPWAEFRGEDRHFAGNLEAWRALEEFHQTGTIRSIGVSNFEQPDIENLLQGGTVKPVVNQILAHVTNTPFDVIDYCHSEGILVEAYSPVGHGELLGNPDILTIAEKYQVSVPQLCIRYTLQLSLLPLPKAANPDHMRQNAELDFEISDEDMDTLKNLGPIKDYGQHSEFPVFWRN